MTGLYGPSKLSHREFFSAIRVTKALSSESAHALRARSGHTMTLIWTESSPASVRSSGRKEFWTEEERLMLGVFRLFNVSTPSQRHGTSCQLPFQKRTAKRKQTVLICIPHTLGQSSARRQGMYSYSRIGITAFTAFTAFTA